MKLNVFKVPVSFQGIPVGVKKGGVLVIKKRKLAINSFASLLPEQIIKDVTKLDIGDVIKVRDLKISEQLNTLENSEDVLAVCKPPQTKGKRSGKKSLKKKQKNERSYILPRL